jgi:type VI secretion system secreted protein Hcp
MSAEEASRIARAAERLRRSTRMPLKVIVPTVAAIGVGGGFAAASIPGANGVVTACYSTLPAVIGQNFQDDTPQYGVPVYGSVRVIDPSAAPQTTTTDWNQSFNTTPYPVYNNACAPWEQQITWNQEGPQGAQGAQGPTGSNGTSGKNGQNASILGAATFEIDAGGGTELFAKLSDITGSAKVSGEQGTIELQSFAFGAESPVIAPKGSGVGAGKATVQTFELTKKVDNTSSTLFKDLQTSKTIAKLEVDADHAAKKGAPTQVGQYALSNVILKSIKQKGGEETVVGVFSKMTSSIGSGNSKVQTQLNPSGAVTYDLGTKSAS